MRAGRAVEYPELEMLAPFSPQISPERNCSPNEIESMALTDEKTLDLTDFGKVRAATRAGETPGAKTWSKMYVEDCVVYPTAASDEGEETRSKSASSHGRVQVGEVGPTDFVEVRHRVFGHEHSSGDVRASTLDFKKILEMDQRVGYEEALGLAVGDSA